MEVDLMGKQQKLCNQPEMTPHVTLSMSEEYQANYIRSMITKLKESHEVSYQRDFQGAPIYMIGENGFCQNVGEQVSSSTFTICENPPFEMTGVSLDLLACGQHTQTMLDKYNV